MGPQPPGQSSCAPIAPMAHGDLHRLTLPHLLRRVPVTAAQNSAEGPRVLDLGAGSGSMSRLMHSAGYRVDACDLEPSLFLFPAVVCRCADLSKPLPYEDASFDAVVCVEVLEHLDGHEALFREVARILKPGGVLLFTTPNVMSIKSRLSFLWTGFHHSFYPLESGAVSPQQWHISGYGGNRYRFVLGLGGLDLREVTCDKLSRTSLAVAWLMPLIWIRSWLRHRNAVGARLNNSMVALLGRTMIGVAVKPANESATGSAGASINALPIDESRLRPQWQPTSNTDVKNRLTVIIPCMNEQENIRACIESVRRIADEVLVADSGSTDGTLAVARELGCRIVEREYRTSGDFKNWAIPQAAHEWILILDADERVTPELAAEVREVLANSRHDGYWIYRRNHFLGHPIRFGPWKNDRCLRLFRRDLGRYVGPTDHAEVELSTGSVGQLRARMTHYTCTSYAQYLPKLARYADVQSRIWHEQGRRTHVGHLLLRFPFRFLQGYLLRLGFLDGLPGLQVCVLVAYLSYLKHAYLWQLQNARSSRELDDRLTANPKEQVGRSAA